MCCKGIKIFATELNVVIVLVVVDAKKLTSAELWELIILWVVEWRFDIRKNFFTRPVGITTFLNPKSPLHNDNN